MNARFFLAYVEGDLEVSVDSALYAGFGVSLALADCHFSPVLVYVGSVAYLAYDIFLKSFSHMTDLAV